MPPHSPQCRSQASGSPPVRTLVSGATAGPHSEYPATAVRSTSSPTCRATVRGSAARFPAPCRRSGRPSRDETPDRSVAPHPSAVGSPGSAGAATSRSLCGPQDRPNRGVRPLVFGQFIIELLSPRRSDAVKANLAIRLGDSPLRCHPSLQQDFLQGVIKSAFLDL